MKNGYSADEMVRAINLALDPMQEKWLSAWLSAKWVFFEADVR